MEGHTTSTKKAVCDPKAYNISHAEISPEYMLPNDDVSSKIGHEM